MRGGRKSKSRRWSGALGALAVLALGPACGGSDAAGFRPGPGGTGGTAGGGSSADAGATDALPAFDGGGCTDDAGGAQHATAASGTFSGGSVAGSVCTGGAFAYVESMPAADGGTPSVALFIDSTDFGSAGLRVRFSNPTDALAGDIHVDIGLPAAAAGTYAQAATCGSAVLNATLPAPDASICASDAAADDSSDCPPGCELIGPFSAQACAPIPPQLTYAALASTDCVGDSTTPAGAWTVNITSIAPFAADAGVFDPIYYEAHGTLSAALADQNPDGGAASVTLDLSF